MSQNNNNARRHSSRRRRRPGVSVMMTIVLMIVSLLMGGLAGYVVARRTDPTVHALQAANDRIMELENTLTLIGFSENADDAEGWVYDADAQGDASSDLAPVDDAGEDDLWSDDSLISGMLSDDGDPVVVAEYDGGQLMSSDVIPAYNDALTDAVFSGRDASQTGDELLLSVMSDMISDRLAAAQAESLGLGAPEGDALKAIRAQAAEIYEARLADYLAFENDPDATPEANRAAAEAKMAEEAGITIDSIVDALTRDWWKQKYYEHVVKDVTVSDDEVQTFYSELLAAQKASFQEDPDECEDLYNSDELVVYRPADYRAVRDVLIPFPTDQARDELLHLMNQIEMGEIDDAWREQVDALYAPLEATAAEAQQKLADGVSFESLMREYGCSDLCKEEPLRSKGLYVRDGGSVIVSPEFTEAALMLEEPGQVSAPVRSYAGVHLVQYVGDAPAGEVPMADVADAVKAAALKQKQGIYFDQQRDAMLEAANAKYYPERLH